MSRRTLAQLRADLDDMAPLSADGTTRYARVAGDYLADLAAEAIEALGATPERVFCRCGRSVLPENWANHLLRQDGQPHERHDCAGCRRSRSRKARR